MDLTKQFLKFLKKANDFFQKGQYLECLEACSLANGILQGIQEDSSIPIKKLSFLQMLTLLADMALEHQEEARALYEYYQVIKKTKNAPKEIIKMIENCDRDVLMLNLAIQRIQEADIDKNDGILYKDFQKVVNNVGFKEAFEDLMFSTKIIFTNKGDFLFFMQNLVDYGFKDIAINYFENIGNILFSDRDFLKIYKRILKSGEC